MTISYGTAILDFTDEAALVASAHEALGLAASEIELSETDLGVAAAITIVMLAPIHADILKTLIDDEIGGGFYASAKSASLPRVRAALLREITLRERSIGSELGGLRVLRMLDGAASLSLSDAYKAHTAWSVATAKINTKHFDSSDTYDAISETLQESSLDRSSDHNGDDVDPYFTARNVLAGSHRAFLATMFHEALMAEYALTSARRPEILLSILQTWDEMISPIDARRKLLAASTAAAEPDSE